MSKKIGFLQRWMFIIDKISAHPYISKQELEAALESEFTVYDGIAGVGTRSRTLERDLSEIRQAPYMDISIEYCRKRKGYYIPTDEKSLSKLNRLFKVSSLLSFSLLKEILFTDHRKSRGLEHRFTLVSAIRGLVEIEIEYRKYSTATTPGQRRLLHPYGLREFKNRWYLLAMEAGETTMKVWGLDRIGKLTLTNRKFTKDPAIDLKKKFEHCFGIYTNSELPPERVVLSFSPLSGKYTDSLPLHESQRTLIHNEEEARRELRVKRTPDFIMELLSQSAGMRVIEPASLRETLIGIHRKALYLLEDTPTSGDNFT